MKMRLCIALLVLGITYTSNLLAQVTFGNTLNVRRSVILDLSNRNNQGILFPHISDFTIIDALNPPNGLIVYYNGIGANSGQLFLRYNNTWQPLAFTNSHWNVNGNALLATTDFIGTPAGSGNTNPINFSLNGTQYLQIATSGIAIGNAPARSGAVLDINQTSSMILPAGDISQRPAVPLTAGMFRYNNEISNIEFWNGSQWVQPTNSVTTGAWALDGNDVVNANYLGTRNNFPLRFRTNNVERFVIDATGNGTFNGALNLGTAATTATTADVVLDMRTNTKSLVLPQGTTTDRPATAIAGMFRYNTTTSILEYYNGTAWISLASNSWALTGNTGTDFANNFLGTTDLVSLNFRTNNQNRLTIASNGASFFRSSLAVNKTSGAVSTNFEVNGTSAISNSLAVGTINAPRPGVLLDVIGTGSITAPVGTSTQRPTTTQQGMLRFNTTINELEVFKGPSVNTLGANPGTLNQWVPVGWGVNGNNTEGRPFRLGTTDAGTEVIHIASNKIVARFISEAGNNTSAGATYALGGNNFFHGRFTVNESSTSGTNITAATDFRHHDAIILMQARPMLGRGPRGSGTTVTGNLFIGEAGWNRMRSSTPSPPDLNVVTTNLNNIIIGDNAAWNLQTTAQRNIAIGSFSFNGQNATSITATDNVIIGNAAAPILTSGASNVLLGASVATNLSTGNNNILIGRSAGGASLTTTSNNIAIGSTSAFSAGANQVILFGNNAYNAATAISDVLVLGNFTNNTTGTSATNVGVRNPNPQAALDVLGETRSTQLRVGAAGTTINHIVTGTATIGPTTIPANAETTINITVNATAFTVRTNPTVTVNPNTDLATGVGIAWARFIYDNVTPANSTIRIVFRNNSSTAQVVNTTVNYSIVL